MIRRFLLAAAFLFAPVAAQAEWHEASSPHFVVYSDDSAESVKTFTEQLERFDQALRKITGTPNKPISPSSRVTIYVVEDMAEIQKLAGSRSVGGFFKPRSWGSVAFVPRKSGTNFDARMILMHEYGHSFMFSAWPDVAFPAWFVEGFAEFVGTAIFRADGSLILGKNPEHRRWSVGNAKVLPARQLVRLKQDKLDDFQTGALYARGWLLTHYLLLGGHAKELGDYIAAINSGKSIDEVNKTLGDVDSLDSKLNAYGARKALPSIKLDPTQVPIGEVKLRKLSPGAAAVMPAQLLSANGVDDKLALKVVELARRLAAAYPRDPAAQNELAEAEFDAKNYEAAAAAADRALSADPKSMHALLYKGMAKIELAKKAANATADQWKEARSWYLMANRLETEYPQPLVLYYESFGAANQGAPKAAENGLLYAYVLAPYDLGLRLQAAKLLLQQGEVKAARTAYEVVAYGPHSGEIADIASKVLDALDSSGTEAALKIVEEGEAEAKAAAEKAKKS